MRTVDKRMRAAWMTPSCPLLTLPDHYPVVTGVRPGRHGITQKMRRDPALGGFKGHGAGMGDGRW